ncbi:MAG: DegT/DnrJ/EryC1/StrS family aminotransferase [Verrucomicrobia bacterium]|nr:DegT/DnrJ/EryC1/StrS family aminotransferase [Verrucomicrobiota bacterium]
MKIPILDLKPAYDELRTELDAAYRRVMDSGWLLLGKELESFEAEYAASVGVAHCIGVANGLEAMQLVLMARGVGPGDEVIVPSHGYIATWLAVTHVGARPIPCEPDPLTYNLDPARLTALITPRTRAILPIHLYGQTADMEAINAIAARHGLFVLEDAAQSHGARSHGTQAGALGHAAGVSFYPSKNLGALADAGAITTNDATLADQLRHLRNYGSKVRYHNDYLGLNSRLSELQAAFLRAKLPHLAAWNARRTPLAARYLDQLAPLAAAGVITLPFVPAWAEPVWHLFVIRTARRDALQAHLGAQGIGTGIHYPIPPHLSHAYRDAGWKRGDFPLAERFADEVLSLPIGPHHTAAQIDFVCATIKDFFRA